VPTTATPADLERGAPGLEARWTRLTRASDVRL
jgi:hypothetical protein